MKVRKNGHSQYSRGYQYGVFPAHAEMIPVATLEDETLSRVPCACGDDPRLLVCSIEAGRVGVCIVST